MIGTTFYIFKIFNFNMIFLFFKYFNYWKWLQKHIRHFAFNSTLSFIPCRNRWEWCVISSCQNTIWNSVANGSGKMNSFRSICRKRRNKKEENKNAKRIEMKITTMIVVNKVYFILSIKHRIKDDQHISEVRRFFFFEVLLAALSPPLLL